MLSLRNENVQKEQSLQDLQNKIIDKNDKIQELERKAAQPTASAALAPVVPVPTKPVFYNVASPAQSPMTNNKAQSSANNNSATQTTTNSNTLTSSQQSPYDINSPSPATTQPPLPYTNNGGPSVSFGTQPLSNTPPSNPTPNSAPSPQTIPTQALAQSPNSSTQKQKHPNNPTNIHLTASPFHCNQCHHSPTHHLHKNQYHHHHFHLLYSQQIIHPFRHKYTQLLLFPHKHLLCRLLKHYLTLICHHSIHTFPSLFTTKTCKCHRSLTKNHLKK
mmetsp:Transcript_274/g.434  ORF Transcript_274/g.434 Transcript_274/m.434 type:complete len:275 (-) Transcript_274:1036-1860(-)